MKESKTKCDMCDRAFPFGPGRYKGKLIEHYQMILCNSCYKMNWNGFGPGLEAQFVSHLKSKGIPLPERNSQGQYPR